MPTTTRVISLTTPARRQPVLVVKGRSISATTKAQRIVTLSKQGARGLKGDAGLTETEINQQINDYDVGDLAQLFLSI